MARTSRTNPRLGKKELAAVCLKIFEEAPQHTFSIKDLFRLIGLRTHPAKMLLIDTLGDLVLDDYLSTDKQGNYRLAVRSALMEGTFVRKRNGHNTFIPQDGGKSILVSERNSLHALDGDTVRAEMLARRHGHTREAQIVEIIRRAKDTFVGRLQVKGDYGFLVTDGRQLSHDIFIPAGALKGARDGDKALVKITEWPESDRNPTGCVVDILGKGGENDTEMHAILAEYGLPYAYPAEVERAAERIDPGITPDEVARREDLRQTLTFTIDPHDAKDFDDALSIRQLQKDLWEVGVHIADVSHYVREGDIIDREARKRATSIYLVDRTIPMLPERLSNYICSLRPDEDKLAYSAIFRMRRNGEVKDWRLVHTVIRSNRRFTYEEVQHTLERNRSASEEDLRQPGPHPEPLPEGAAPEGEWAEELIVLNEMAKALREKRFKRGAIGFDRAEVRFDIDKDGRPLRTYFKVAKDANRLVEEFMLLANRSVAERVALPAEGGKSEEKQAARKPAAQQQKVLPYRIHDVPDPEKLERLRAFVAQFGCKLKTEGTKTDVSRSLNKLLAGVRGQKEAGIVEMVALRAMQKARYSTDNIGHYGLMFDYYTHFTSPIRRYPDTMVHRLLTRYENGGATANKAACEALCQHASAMEQLAAAAERASIKYKQVEFMSERLGCEYTGTVSGVTEFGLYVEIDENKCEGLVGLRALDDDLYVFDERNYRLTGRRSGRRYTLGDAVTVRVERANLERRQLDFRLVGHSGSPLPPQRPKGKPFTPAGSQRKSR
ncbi:MAG: ribonuclease R [Prevotellaceae bacterium]|nr:ribonuclease R [Prevotellaceae bacterium]